MSHEMFTFLVAYLVVGGVFVLFGVPPLTIWLVTPAIAYLWREAPES